MESLHIKSKVKEQRNHNDWDNESEEYNSSSTSEIDRKISPWHFHTGGDSAAYLWSDKNSI